MEIKKSKNQIHEEADKISSWYEICKYVDKVGLTLQERADLLFWWNLRNLIEW